MLVVMLMAAASVRLWPLVRAQPLCRTRTVRTGKVLDVPQQVLGDALYFASDTTLLINHPCEKNIAIYLGRQVFVTQNNFHSSLVPFTIPSYMGVGVPEVTSVHFAGELLLLVVNKKLYSYSYKEDIWGVPIGIGDPVSHVSGDNCCFVGNTFCIEISNSVFVYSRGDEISQSTIYFSDTGGVKFHKYTIKREDPLVGTLGGVFYFHSLSQVGILLVNNGKGMFAYLDHPLNRSLGLAFDYNGTLDVIISPGQRGFLILWNEQSLAISPNSGQLVNSVPVKQGETILYSSILEANITIHTVAANDNELAVLTREDNVLYGSLEFLSSSVIKFPHQPLWSPETALMFLGPGMLEIVTPIPDAHFSAFDFNKCLLNIQAILMDPDLEVEKCKIELLKGNLDEEMYTIDMNSQLNLSAILIPRQGTAPIPLVMVSNPHSLGMQASIYEFDHTLDGNKKFKLDIHLMQQHHAGRTDPNFTSSIKRPTTSTLTVDIANKEISCVDMKPLSVLISVGCDLDKRIAVQKKISACSKGILDPVVLQENYTYIIEKEAYDPNYYGQKATKDLRVLYPYKELGCPRLVYYDTPWKPVIELWQKEKFQEIVNAEYVLREANGLFTYSYSLTARSALCIRQPQNWTSVMKTNPTEDPFMWDRENYVSCHDPSNPTPLRWPDVQYEILGGPTNNEIIFDQRNGIYIFYLSIVDPYYSYCQLETTFSIYVYGAYPLSIIPEEIAILLLVLGSLLAVWLAYVIPKQLHTEDCRQACDYVGSLCQSCRAMCACRRRSVSK